MTGLIPEQGASLFERPLSRRTVVKSGGALVVAFSTLGAALGARSANAAAGTFDSNGPYDSQQLDSWLAVHGDNTVSMKLGMIELGQGSTTGLLMIAAEELNCDMSQMRMIANDTDVTPNQGGTYGSQAVHVGGKQTRAAAAAAHQTLLAIASAALMFTAGVVGHRPSMVLPILAALNFCWGSLMPLAQSWFNEQLRAAERATLLSFNSTFATLGGSMGLLAGGVIADRAGVQATWQFGGLLSLAVVPCYLALRTRRVSAAPIAETPG